MTTGDVYIQILGGCVLRYVCFYMIILAGRVKLWNHGIVHSQVDTLAWSAL